LKLFNNDNNLFTIKILITDKHEGIEQNKLFEDIIEKGVQNKVSEEKYYNIYEHSFETDTGTLFVVSFEIIFKHYYINIRVNTLEKQENEQLEGLKMFIHNIILTIIENDI
jgi:hypothetical protein